MLITERAQQLSVDAQTYQDHLKGTEQDQQLLDVINRFAAWTGSAERALSLYAEASTRGVAVPAGQDDTIKTARKDARALRRELAKPDVGTAVLNRKAYDSARLSAEKLVNHLERLAKEAWDAAYAEAFPDGVDEVNIPDLPGIAQQAARAGRLTAQARALAINPLTELQSGKTAVEQFDRLENTGAELLEARKALTDALGMFPTDVRAFIEAAAAETGASLSLLTDAVRAWLDEHGQLDEYRVLPK